jgi:L-threonylcarbamoyladenylate synthase
VSQVDAAVSAIRAGELAVIPTDTVYGLVCDPNRSESVQRLSDVKGRAPDQPIAIVATSVEQLLQCIPELHERSAAAARLLLPGPYTLVLPNPAGRYPWLGASRPDTIGVRVPDFSGVGKAVLDAVGAVAATSANLHRGRNPCSVEDVPGAIRSQAVLVDGGELPGIPSTVVDLTGDEPRVLREGAVSAFATLRAVGEALSAQAAE